jgi:epoxyqueuosine reductase
LFNPPLDKLAELTEQDFRRVFAHSPIKRPKYRGWLRNLSVVLGNSGDRRFLSNLEELSRHDDPIVREHAQWAIARLNRT